MQEVQDSSHVELAHIVLTDAKINLKREESPDGPGFSGDTRDSVELCRGQVRRTIDSKLDCRDN